MNKIQHKAQKHAQDRLLEFAAAACDKPWNEFMDMIAETYLAGAADGIECQWRQAAVEKPAPGQNVLVCFKWYNTGTRRWHTDMVVARYTGDREFEHNGVTHWMPIPPITTSNGSIIEP